MTFDSGNDKMDDDLRRENAELRRLITQLILGEQTKKTLWPGQEECPVLDLPHPCACGNVIIERFLFKPDRFHLTIADKGMMQVEGIVKEVSLHDIDYHDGIVCRKCGRKFVRKWTSS